MRRDHSRVLQPSSEVAEVYDRSAPGSAYGDRRPVRHDEHRPDVGGVRQGAQLGLQDLALVVDRPHRATLRRVVQEPFLIVAGEAAVPLLRLNHEEGVRRQQHDVVLQSIVAPLLELEVRCEAPGPRQSIPQRFKDERLEGADGPAAAGGGVDYASHWGRTSSSIS
jgi:hypothetical protein